MRKYEIDYLRVLAFLILILYHSGMVFVPWDYHIKNNETSTWFDFPMFFTNQWRLALLFVISGIGTYFSISRRSIQGFTLERFRRLMVPFIFGVLVIVPPQVYFERLVDGTFFSSFWDFYIHDAFTKGWYPDGGNLSWHHLWFILYLFVFSIVLVVVRKPLDSLSPYLKKSIAFHNGLGIFLVLSIPVFLCECFLRPYYPMTLGLVNDWFALSEYLWFFLCGYLIARCMDDIWPLFQKSRKLTLCIGVGAYLIYGLIYPLPDLVFIKAVLRALNVWGMIFALIGFAITYLNKNSKWLSYANEAVYPFYILHQTVLIGIAYYLRDWEMFIIVKFLIVVGGTTVICWVLYHFLIRKINILRFLFGMKPLVKKPVPQHII